MDDEHHRLFRTVGLKARQLGRLGILLGEEHTLQFRNLRSGACERDGERDGEVRCEVHGVPIHRDGLLLQRILKGKDAAIALETGHGGHTVINPLHQVIGAPILVGFLSHRDDW